MIKATWILQKNGSTYHRVQSASGSTKSHNSNYVSVYFLTSLSKVSYFISLAEEYPRSQWLYSAK